MTIRTTAATDTEVRPMRVSLAESFKKLETYKRRFDMHTVISMPIMMMFTDS